jgi:hypothetical protein
LCDIHGIAGLVPIAMLWTTVIHIFVFEIVDEYSGLMLCALCIYGVLGYGAGKATRKIEECGLKLFTH